MCFRRYLGNFYAPNLTDHLMGAVITCLRILPALAFPFRQMEAKAKMAGLGHRVQPPGGDMSETHHQMVTPGCQDLSPMMSQMSHSTAHSMLSSSSISSTLNL